MSTAYRILDGAIKRFKLSPEGNRIPGLEGTNHSVRRVSEGDVHVAWSGTIADAAVLTARLTPGVTWWFAPWLADSDLWGACFRQIDRAPVCFVAARVDAMNLTETVFHEAFHANYLLLNDFERRALEAAIAVGPARSARYQTDPEERQARFSQRRAMNVVETGRMVTHPGAPEILVMDDIYEGVFGRRRQIVSRPVYADELRAVSTKSGFPLIGGFREWLRAG